MPNISSFQYARLLANAFKQAESSKEIKEVAGEFLKTLKKNNDLGKIEKIIESFRTYDEKQEKTQEIEVWAPRSLSVESKKRIISILEKKDPEKRVEIKENIVPQLLGGIIIKKGDLMVDASLKGKLERMEKHLL